MDTNGVFHVGQTIKTHDSSCLNQVPAKVVGFCTMIANHRDGRTAPGLRVMFEDGKTADRFLADVGRENPEIVSGAFKAAPETIDLTPTWRGAMQIIIAGLEDGTEEGRKLARAELMTLADKLDGRPEHTPPATVGVDPTHAARAVIELIRGDGTSDSQQRVIDHARRALGLSV